MNSRAIGAITFDLWDTVFVDDSDEPRRAARGLGTKAQDRRRLVQESQGLTQVGQGRPVVEGRRVVLLAEFVARRIGEDRQVPVVRRSATEQSLQVDLAGGGVEEVRSPHHVGDALGCIVHLHRQLVSIQAVLALQDKVLIGLLVIQHLRPLKEILIGGTIVVNNNTHCMGILSTCSVC